MEKKKIILTPQKPIKELFRQIREEKPIILKAISEGRIGDLKGKIDFVKLV